MFKVFAFLFCFTVSVTSALAETTVTETRDASGKLLYKSRTSGDKTEVRSPSGKLLLKSRNQGDTTEVRSPSGKLLQRSKTK